MTSYVKNTTLPKGTICHYNVIFFSSVLYNASIAAVFGEPKNQGVVPSTPEKCPIYCKNF